MVFQLLLFILSIVKVHNSKTSDDGKKEHDRGDKTLALFNFSMRVRVGVGVGVGMDVSVSVIVIVCAFNVSYQLFYNEKLLHTPGSFERCIFSVPHIIELAAERQRRHRMGTMYEWCGRTMKRTNI